MELQLNQLIKLVMGLIVNAEYICETLFFFFCLYVWCVEVSSSFVLVKYEETFLVFS